MRIVFMGTPDFAVPSMEALLAAGLDCNVRAEKLTLEEFAALLGAIEEVKA